MRIFSKNDMNNRHPGASFWQRGARDGENPVVVQAGNRTLKPIPSGYLAMENGPFIDGLPIKTGDFSWLC